MTEGGVDPIWDVVEVDTEMAGRLADAVGVPPLIARLMVQRGIATSDEARAFLEPRLANLPDPATMRGMDAAVERLLRAMQAGEGICVWGDYDVDGVTSVSQLVNFFRAVNVAVGFHVPDRFDEGYGLNGQGLRDLARSGVRLVVAVDCGISNAAEIEAAVGEGIDVIVVDHHRCPPVLPRAVAILNPLQPGCEFPDKRLAACGLTWMLLIALSRAMRDRGLLAAGREPDLRGWLDLTAIGTVADMVPLTATNRIIASVGLRRIGSTERVGVRALCAVAGFDLERITAGRVGFHLAPRLNAAGRMAHARDGVELLTTDDPERARTIAQLIDRHNRERRETQDGVFRQACALADEHPDPAGRRSIVLAHAEWHAGVLGIVASKLVERHHRPTILLRVENGIARGSARSIDGFPLVEHLHELALLLDKYGGHDRAAGLAFAAERLDVFRDAFEARAVAALEPDRLRPRLRIDAEVPLRAVSEELVESLGRLAPHGMGNPEPSFMAREVPVVATRQVGNDGSHLKLTLDSGRGHVDAIAFSMAHRSPKPRARIDVVYVPEINVWQGASSVQIRVKALREA